MIQSWGGGGGWGHWIYWRPFIFCSRHREVSGNMEKPWCYSQVENFPAIDSRITLVRLTSWRGLGVYWRTELRKLSLDGIRKKPLTQFSLWCSRVPLPRRTSKKHFTHLDSDIHVSFLERKIIRDVRPASLKNRLKCLCNKSIWFWL